MTIGQPSCILSTKPAPFTVSFPSMRRLLRWAFNGTAAVLALLFVATCVLWVRSYWHADYAWDGTATDETGIISAIGHMFFYHETAIGTFRLGGPAGFGVAERPAPSAVEDFAPPNTQIYHNEAGFGRLAGDDGHTAQGCWFVPFWAIAGLLAVIPIQRACQFVRRSPTPLTSRVCSGCGYDLRRPQDVARNAGPCRK